MKKETVDYELEARNIIERGKAELRDTSPSTFEKIEKAATESGAALEYKETIKAHSDRMDAVNRRRDLEKTAIERLRAASDMSLKYYEKPLVVTTSGGKDSSVCVALAERAGIPFEIMHNHTTVDAPETVYFIRSEFKRLEEKGIKCTVNYPVYKGKPVTMWSLIPQKLMPPTRIVMGLCTRCGGVGVIVHHKTELSPSNINDPSVTLAEDNLVTLCRKCHAIVHGRTPPIAEGLAFDDEGNVVPIGAGTKIDDDEFS